MKVIYIAGKYRGPTPWAIEQNIRAAEDVAAKVWAAGHVALCPHANARHMLDGNTADEAALAGTMELLRRCDAVLCVSNWRDSAGARAEVEEARRLGLPVFGVGREFKREELTPLTMDAAVDNLCEWADGDVEGVDVVRVPGGSVVLPVGMAEWLGAEPITPPRFIRKHGTVERWDVCDCDECEAARPHPFVADDLDP